MGLWSNPETTEIAKITEPILNELRKNGKEGMIDVDALHLDEQNKPHVSKKAFFGREQLYPVLFKLENPLLDHLLKLKKTYNVKLYLPVIPFCLWTRAALLFGLPLENILNDSTFKKGNICSEFIITNDKNGEILAKLEFQVEKRDANFILQMEKLTTDFPTTRYVHCILNKNKLIVHLDGAKFYYEKNYKHRISNKYSFDKEAKKESVFRIDGAMPNKELMKIGKLYFEIHCKYLKIKRSS